MILVKPISIIEGAEDPENAKGNMKRNASEKVCQKSKKII